MFHHIPSWLYYMEFFSNRVTCGVYLQIQHTPNPEAQLPPFRPPLKALRSMILFIVYLMSHILLLCNMFHFCYRRCKMYSRYIIRLKTRTNLWLTVNLITWKKERTEKDKLWINHTLCMFDSFYVHLPFLLEFELFSSSLCRPFRLLPSATPKMKMRANVKVNECNRNLFGTMICEGIICH